VTAFIDLPRLRPGARLAAAGLVALLAGPGCDGDSPGETQPPAEAPAAVQPASELAALAFEAVVYVEPTANNITVLDRVRHELKSAFSALELRRITISQRRQVDVDLKRLSREPITVVDPITHAARPAVRVRYRFLGVGSVSRAQAQRGDELLALLHRDDALHAAEVVELCTSPASRGSDAVKQPWRAFDPSLEACARAVDAEQTKIDEARASLEHPDREIVPIELDRIYLPVVLHVKLRAAAGPGSSASGGGPAARPGGSATGVGSAVASAAAALDPAALAAAQRADRLLAKLKLAEKQGVDADAEEREIADILGRRAAGGLPGGEGGPNTPFLGYGGEPTPVNYALLWFATIAVVALLGTEIRRRLLRRGTRRPRR
jgi:hypothetical protein